MEQQPWVVKPKGKPNYVVRWRDPATGKIRQRSTGTTQRRKAERLADEVAEEIDVGVDQSAPTWSQFCARYVREGMQHCRQTTIAKWMVTQRHVTRELKPTLVTDLTANRLSTLRADLEEGGMRAASVDGVIRHLMVALRWAASIGVIKQAPTLPRPKRGGSRGGMKGRPISLEEFERMLASTERVVAAEHAASWQHLMWVGWYSGLRLNELLQLTWDDHDSLRILDIDSEEPLMQIPAAIDKGGLNRMQPITHDLANYLRRTPEAEREGYVVAPAGPRGVTRNLQWVSARISKIGKLARVVVSKQPRKFASAHDFRRSFGERWSGRVMPDVLRHLMRHEDIKTTYKYYVGRDSRRLAASVWDWSSHGVASQRDPERDPSVTAEKERIE